MRVYVKKAFRLTRDDHSIVHYGTGIHDMPEKDAEHWYTKAHSESLPVMVAAPNPPDELGEEERSGKGKRT